MGGTASQRTHIVISRELVARIDALVGSRGRSRFLVDAAERELKRHAQVEALRIAAGSWKSRDHAELRAGSAAWVKRLRHESERRLKRPRATGRAG